MNKIILLVGLLCAAAAGFLVWQKLEAAEARLASVAYLTYSKDAGDPILYAGDEVSAGDIGRIELPNGHDVFQLGDQLIEDTAANRSWLEGKKLNATIPRGRVLTYDLFEKLADDRLDLVVSPGMRAISLSVSSATSLNSRVVPGNRIDLLGVIESEGPARAEVVLEDVKVIAVGKAISYDAYRSEGSRSYSTITIEVRPEEGVKLAQDRRRVKGEFIVMLRNQCDTSQPSATCG